MLWGAGGLGIDGFCQHGHLCHLLQNHGVVHRLRGVPAPGEGAVVPADDGGDVDGIDAPQPEGLHHHMPGVGLIVRLYLLLCQVSGTGDGAIEVVGVGRAISGDITARLRPRYRIGAVGVNDSADFREGVVQHDMGLCIRGGVQLPLYLPALQIQHHQILGLQVLIAHPGGLDDKQPLLSVDAADISIGVGHKPPAGQLHVGLVYLSMVVCKGLPYEAAIEQNSAEHILPSFTKHWFGTDEFGRDLFAKVVHGTTTSITLGIIAVAIATIIGTIAGYFGGIIDTVIMRLVDIQMAIPAFLMVIVTVNGMSVFLEQGKTLGIVGETGAGETTIAYSIMQVLPKKSEKIYGGEILLDGENLLKMSEKEKRALWGSKIERRYLLSGTAILILAAISLYLEKQPTHVQ